MLTTSRFRHFCKYANQTGTCSRNIIPYRSDNKYQKDQIFTHKHTKQKKAPYDKRDNRGGGIIDTNSRSKNKQSQKDIRTLNSISRRTQLP